MTIERPLLPKAFLLVLSAAGLMGCAIADVSEGPSATPESQSWVHERPDGHARVVESTVPASRGQTCDTTVRESLDFSIGGRLKRRTVETRRCGIVESKLVESWDGQMIVRELAIDTDHDGAFDYHDRSTSVSVGRTPRAATRTAFSENRRAGG